jgi:phytoene dehydrogenase-like protein
MSYDFVVVGGGIGGLTTAALLSARGFSTCLFERQSQVGGCIGRVEFSNHDFEPGMGLYSSFGPGEIYEQVFAELPVEIPETTRLDSNYVVRLFDGQDVRLFRDEEFYEEIRRVFPECGDNAVAFYEKLDQAKKSGGILRALRALRSGQLNNDAPITNLLHDTSERFRSFIESQLLAFLHQPLEGCTFGAARAALALPRSQLYSLKGNIATLAERLAEAIKKSGGTLRLNSPVLRLAYDQSGAAIGVDLLSGERVIANRAIISNMTIWDTYGKLIGLNRTPTEIKKALQSMQSSGVYVIYASMEESAISRLPEERLMVTAGTETANTDFEFTFAVGTGESPSGKKAVTLKMRTDVGEWFTFQSSEEDYDEWDQAALERFWSRIHKTLTELGADVEVIETATPRTYYDQTRRKLGMVMGLNSNSASPHPQNTSIPNLFLVGDTSVFPPNLAQVTSSAAKLTTRLLK